MLCGDSHMVWMLMPGQTWAGAAASFIAMWMAMMVPMMLPSLAPVLWRCGRAVGAGMVAAGYFFVWALLGFAVYPLGMLLAGIATRPAAGAVVLAAGLMQFSAWKRRQLACCRDHRGEVPADVPTAWLHGMRLGLRCMLCCANLMAVLLAIGMMNPAAMAAVTAAVTLERLAPQGARVARGTGVVIAGAALVLLARAAGG